jgi:hypothetical protein
VRASDTTPDAEAVRLSILRKQDGAQRLATAIELSDAVRELSLAGLRARHPDLTDRTALRALMRVIYAAEELPPDFT